MSHDFCDHMLVCDRHVDESSLDVINPQKPHSGVKDFLRCVTK